MTPAEKRKLRLAAIYSDLSVSEFVRRSAFAAAEIALAKRADHAAEPSPESAE